MCVLICVCVSSAYQTSGSDGGGFYLSDSELTLNSSLGDDYLEVLTCTHTNKQRERASERESARERESERERERERKGTHTHTQAPEGSLGEGGRRECLY